MQYGLDAFDLSLRTLDGCFGLISLGSRFLDASLSRCVIATALIESLLGDYRLSDELLAAFEIGFRVSQDCILLKDNRFRLSHRLFGALHVGLRRPQLGFVFRRQYAPDDLSLGDFASFFERNVGQPAGIFSRDLD